MGSCKGCKSRSIHMLREKKRILSNPRDVCNLWYSNDIVADYIRLGVLIIQGKLYRRNKENKKLLIL